MVYGVHCMFEKTNKTQHQFTCVNSRELAGNAASPFQQAHDLKQHSINVNVTSHLH